MTHEDVVRYFGNGTKAANALGYSRQAVSQWKRVGIPFEAQSRIQLKTKGRLKAVLPERRQRKAA